MGALMALIEVMVRMVLWPGRSIFSRMAFEDLTANARAVSAASIDFMTWVVILRLAGFLAEAAGVLGVLGVAGGMLLK
jgi:hypothetical protein